MISGDSLSDVMFYGNRILGFNYRVALWFNNKGINYESQSDQPPEEDLHYCSPGKISVLPAVVPNSPHLGSLPEADVDAYGGSVPGRVALSRPLLLAKTQLLLDKDYNHPWPFYCAFLQTIRKCPEVGGRLQDSFSESPHPAATRESPDSHLSSGDWIDIALGSPREVRLRKLTSETQWIHWGRGDVSIIYLPCCPTVVFRPRDGSTRRFMPASRGLVDRTQTGHGEDNKRRKSSAP